MNLNYNAAVEILHVDDDASFLSLFSSKLHSEYSEDLVVTSVSDPEKAIELVKNDDFDCVVSDYQMPSMDGIELLEELNEIDPYLPFILLTAEGNEEVASEAISKGVDDYLVKDTSGNLFSRLMNKIQNSVETYRARRKIEEKNQQIKHITENIPAGLLMVSEDGLIKFANKKIEELYGYQSDSLIDSSLSILVSDVEKLKRSLDHYETTEDASAIWQVLENKSLTKNGEKLDVEVTSTVYDYHDKTLLIGIVRDVSDIRSAEKNLDEQKERMRQIANNIHEVVWMSDLDKDEMLYVNDAYESVWGRSKKELYENPLSFLDGIHEDDRERVRQSLEKQKDGSYDEEYRVVRPDGEVRWVQDRSVPLRDESGEVYRIVGVARDVTELKKREDKLELKNSALDALPTGVVIAENAGDFEIMYANKGYVEMTGYTKEEAIGRNCRFLQGEATDPEIVSETREALMNEEEIEVKIRNYRKDGEMFWNNLSILPIKNENGEVTHFVGCQNDITSLVQEIESLEETVQCQKNKIDRLLSDELETELNSLLNEVEQSSDNKDLEERVNNITDIVNSIDTALQDLDNSLEDCSKF